MRLYQHKFGVKMQHIWHNEPAKPDVSCYLEQQRLDLEIAHLYGSEAEAMKILGRELERRHAGRTAVTRPNVRWQNVYCRRWIS